MAQLTNSTLRDQINRLRSQPEDLFNGLLDRTVIEEALEQEGIRWRACVYTPMITLWTFVLQILDPDHSCRAAVSRLSAYLTSVGRRCCSPDTGPYCKARSRLPLSFISRLVRTTGRNLDETSQDTWKWKGHSVYIFDGTTVSMPDTQDNQKAFPQPRTQKPGLGFPIARLVVVISLASGAVRRLAMGAYKGKGTGEPSLLRSIWDEIERGAVALGDRCFGSFFGIAGLLVRGVDSVFRCYQGRKIDFNTGKRLGEMDHITTWVKPQRPKDMDISLYDSLPSEMEIREVGYRVMKRGFRVRFVILATTLLDATKYSVEDLAELYYERWNIEVDLRTIKVELSMNVLRCKTPDMVEKEVWMHMLVYNLVRTLMSKAAARSGTAPRKLSFKGAMQAIRSHSEAMMYAMEGRREILYKQLLEIIVSNKVGHRRGRVEPRGVKRRPKPGRLLLEPRHAARKRLQEAA